MKTTFDPIDDFEFCRNMLYHLGFKGCLLHTKEVYNFLYDYLSVKGYKTAEKEYYRILDVCQVAATATKYIPLLRWQLGMILAANALCMGVYQGVDLPPSER